MPGLNGVCGRPPFWPAGSPVAGVRLASGRLCFRLSGSRVFGAGVPHLLCADKSADSVGHVKCPRRCPPRRDGQISWCSALVFKGQRGKRRNAAASGTVLKRELSHRKSDFRFARFRRASSMIRKEITARSARMPHNPFHGRGGRPKADHVVSWDWAAEMWTVRAVAPDWRTEMRHLRPAIAARAFPRYEQKTNLEETLRHPEKKVRSGECANELADSGWSAVQNKRDHLQPRLASDAKCSNESSGQREEVSLRA